MMYRKIVTSILILFLLLAGLSYIFATNNKDEETGKNSTFEEKVSNETQEEKTVEVANFNTQPDVTKLDKEEKQENIKITAVGDILLGRGVGFRLKNNNRSIEYPFEKVADLLKQGDIVFGNLEEPITDSAHSLTGIKDGGKWVLKNSVESIETIKYAGFNLMNLANNHILDYYKKGLKDTINLLNENSITYAGAGMNIDEAKSLAVMQKKGVKIGMLSYTDMAEIYYKGNPNLRFLAEKDRFGVSPIKYKDDNFDYEYFKREIEAVKDKADILIVSLHWGIEESFNITPDQIEFAHFLIDNGVDIILGHHPHQFQGIEVYNNKPIAYSLGNFIFDQNDPENQESFILNIQIEGEKLTSLTAIPVRTIEKTQVVPQTGENAQNILNRQVKLCQELGTECMINEDRLIFKLE